MHKVWHYAYCVHKRGVVVEEKERLMLVTDIVRSRSIANQKDLHEALSQSGIKTTQSSISRDLKKLGVVKVEGRYRLPQIVPGESALVDRLDVTAAGPNLVVVRTGPGNANRAAVIIDSAGIPGLLGTIAGDDTIFIAVTGDKDQSRIIRHIFSLFERA